jgi:hypothetical protein
MPSRTNAFFHQSMVEFLDYIISGDGICMDRKRTSTKQTLHSSTKQIPFFSNSSHHPRPDPFQVKDVGSPAAYLAAIHDELAFQLYEFQDCYKTFADRNQKIHPNFHM